MCSAPSMPRSFAQPPDNAPVRGGRRKSRWAGWSIAALATCWLVATWFLDARTRPLMINTLVLATAVCLVSVPWGCGLAWIITRTQAVGRQLALVLLVACLFWPVYLQVAGWQAGLGQQGWLQMLTGNLATTPVLAGWRGAIWVHAVAALPWVVLLISAALSVVPPEWEEAARLETGAWGTLCWVTWPLIRPAVTVATVWVFAMTAGDMTVTDVYRIRTFAEEAFLGFALDDPQASALLGNALPEALTPLRASWLFGGGLTVWIAAAMMMAMRGWFVTPRHGAARRGPSLVGGRWRVSLMLWGSMLLLWGVPLANLIFNAGLRVEWTGNEVSRHWSLLKCLKHVAESPWRFRWEFVWSFSVANVTALVSLTLALPLAWWARRSRWGTASVIGLAAVCLVIPGPVLGIGTIGLLNHDIPWLAFLYDRTIAAPCLAMTVRVLPLVLLILWQGFRSLPEATLEAAQLDGAHTWQRLVYIVLPQRVTMLWGAWWVALAIAMGDLAASVLVVPPGVQTLAIRIFGLVHYGVDDRLAGLCLSVVLLFLGVGLVAGWLWRSWTAPGWEPASSAEDTR